MKGSRRQLGEDKGVSRRQRAKMLIRELSAHLGSVTEGAPQIEISDDANVAPMGRRSGEGAASLLPYLEQSLRTKPKR